MKILNFGSCNIDYVYSMDHIVRVGETEATDSLSVFSGGKGLNQSIALSRAGAYVYHAGCIGEDGDLLLDVLEQSKVDTSYIHRVNAKNGHAVIQVSREGENSIFLYRGSNDMITKEQVDNVLANFNKGDILLLQNEISLIEYIIDKAHARGMRIIFNPSPCSENILSIDLSKISYIILNEVEAQKITGRDIPEEALSYFEGNYPELCVVLTLGSRGSIYQGEGQRVYQSCFKVKAVDTTAAGDTFTGYFIAELVRGSSPKEIMRLASCASAISVSRMGAAPSIPSREEVLANISHMEEGNQ